jgi:hypothetical protein
MIPGEGKKHSLPPEQLVVSETCAADFMRFRANRGWNQQRVRASRGWSQQRFGVNEVQHGERTPIGVFVSAGCQGTEDNAWSQLRVQQNSEKGSCGDLA